MSCPRCSECQGQRHHWVPNDDESAGAPDWACKHCETGYGWSCIGCDAVNAEPDVECAACDADDAEYEADFS